MAVEQSIHRKLDIEIVSFDAGNHNSGRIVVACEIVDPPDFLSGNDVRLVSDQRQLLRSTSKPTALVYVASKYYGQDPLVLVQRLEFLVSRRRIVFFDLFPFNAAYKAQKPLAYFDITVDGDVSQYVAIEEHVRQVFVLVNKDINLSPVDACDLADP